MKAKQTKSALIIGASGLVGKLLLEAILQKDYYASITLVLRRSIDLKYDHDFPNFHKPVTRMSFCNDFKRILFEKNALELVLTSSLALDTTFDEF